MVVVVVGELVDEVDEDDEAPRPVVVVVDDVVGWAIVLEVLVVVRRGRVVVVVLRVVEVTAVVGTSVLPGVPFDGWLGTGRTRMYRPKAARNTAMTIQVESRTRRPCFLPPVLLPPDCSTARLMIPTRPWRPPR